MDDFTRGHENYLGLPGSRVNLACRSAEKLALPLTRSVGIKPQSHLAEPKATHQVRKESYFDHGGLCVLCARRKVEEGHSSESNLLKDWNFKQSRFRADDFFVLLE
jgi:hypothetical protein